MGQVRAEGRRLSKCITILTGEILRYVNYMFLRPLVMCSRVSAFPFNRCRDTEEEKLNIYEGPWVERDGVRMRFCGFVFFFFFFFIFSSAKSGSREWTLEKVQLYYLSFGESTALMLSS